MSLAAQHARTRRGHTGMWRFRYVWDGKVCVYCGAAAECTDHPIPLARGGTHDLDNLVPACRWCNSSKGSLSAEEFMVVLPICQQMRPLRDRLKALKIKRDAALLAYRARSA